ncbi:hypothetical protein PRIC2_005036 [Phytophthora ramorum]
MRARADAKRDAQQTPRFAYLLRLGLESVGVRYVSVDLLRKAKKNQTTEVEYWTLWRLLHDLVLVVLADFQVDEDEMQRMDDSELLDPELHDIQMELVRVYLYEWGFVCTAFYPTETTGGRPSSQVLLLAVAWLLAFSRFFERQQRFILERCTSSKQPSRLPPFPNDVDLDVKCVRDAALDAVSSVMVPHDPTLPLDGQMHQLHCAFGRLLGHLNELEAYARYHQRLVKRLEIMQNKSEEHRDELIPVFVLNLIAGSTSQLTDQVRLLSQSVQMIEDEALFYKWINGLVRSLNSDGDSESPVSPLAMPESGSYSALCTQIQEAQALFQTHTASFQKIEQGYKGEWKKWTSRQKSRSRVQQLETKVERFTHEVQTRELFDPQKLFLLSQRSWEASNPGIARHEAKVHLTTMEEVERLKSQVASVIGEITREYCDLQLR